MKLFLITALLIPQLCFSLTGLKVGDKAPDLNFRNTEGKSFELSKIKGKSVFIFYRGSWCPYCVKQLKAVQSDVMGKIDKRAQLFAISVDRRSVAKKMKDRNKFKFHVVSDPKAKTLMAFNIVNKLEKKLVEKYKASYGIDVEGDSGETHHMVAHPAVFILENGKVIFADVHTNYKERTRNSEILKNI